MDTELIYVGITIFTFVWLFISFLTTREVVDYPLLSPGKKISYLVVLWIIPFIGAYIVHKVIGLGWAKGNGVSNGSSDGQVLPPD